MLKNIDVNVAFATDKLNSDGEFQKLKGVKGMEGGEGAEGSGRAGVEGNAGSENKVEGTLV